MLKGYFNWDWDNQVCLSCSKDWTFNGDKKCVPVSDQCKTHQIILQYILSLILEYDDNSFLNYIFC